jgi:hypothetical protein
MRVYSRIWTDKPTLYNKVSYDGEKTHRAEVNSHNHALATIPDIANNKE